MERFYFKIREKHKCTYNLYCSVFDNIERVFSKETGSYY